MTHGLPQTKKKGQNLAWTVVLGNMTWGMYFCYHVHSHCNDGEQVILGSPMVTPNVTYAHSNSGRTAP